jgi:hypothetical protein
VVIAWRDALGIGSKLQVQQIIERAALIQELRNALLAVAEERARPGFISAKRLGWWLKKNGRKNKQWFAHCLCRNRARIPALDS